jgi:hypothetical protein
MKKIELISLAGMILMFGQGRAIAAPYSEGGAPRSGLVHRLIHRVAALDLVCGGYEKPGQARACRKTFALVDRLKRLGWCWGSVDRLAADGEKYWLPCWKEPSRPPHQLRGHNT